MTMQIWKIERKDRGGCDTFDMAVVAAATEEDAKHTNPNGWQVWIEGKGWVRRSTGETEGHGGGYGWTYPDNVTVTKIGTAEPDTERGVIVASFNAG